VQKISSRKELLERIKDVRCVEIEARARYDDDVHTFEKRWIKRVLNQIVRDEDRHIEMLNKLIRILS
jgi:rubrerythrin